MSVAAAVFETLDADADLSAAVGGRISPYMRNRDDEFPAVLYSVPREEFVAEAITAATRIAEIEVAAIARSLATADAIAEKVIVALGSLPAATAACISGVRSVSIERDVLDAYDGSVSLLYRATVRATAHVSGV